MRKTSVLDRGSHSVYLLTFHLVLVVKYRKNVLNDIISNRIKEIGEKIGEKYGIEFIEYNHDINHIHLLFKAKPDTSISTFIGSFKSASSRIIKKEFPEIKSKLWKESFWSPSYCLLTTGGAPIEVIKRYIENQGYK